MGVERVDFGTLETGEKVGLYVIGNGRMTMSCMDYGATWVSALLPSPRGPAKDALLGFSTLSGFSGPHPFFGVSVGRYANRISGHSFSIGPKKFLLGANDGTNCLHGGFQAWDKRVWKAKANAGKNEVVFSIVSPDGDGGFPGRVEASVSYRLTKENEVLIRFGAKTDAPTHVNMTNHAYFNLGDGPDILDHVLTLKASGYLPIDAASIPLGEIASVAGTPFDFRAPKVVKSDIAAVGQGYDHCYVIDRDGAGMSLAAVVEDPASGRKMTVKTSQPGIQLYTGNYLNGELGKRGTVYKRHAGLCLETQHFPDSPNRPAYPSTLLNPGQSYEHSVSYGFSF
jgi:aldose 1-epimerase